jgi:hypothetical protein
MRAELAVRLFGLLSVIAGSMFFASTAGRAQVRGVYPVGMNATNSGVTPEAGITYSNLFVFFHVMKKEIPQETWSPPAETRS